MRMRMRVISPGIKRGDGRAAATLAVMIVRKEIEGTEQQAIDWLNQADEEGFDSADLLVTLELVDPRDES